MYVMKQLLLLLSICLFAFACKRKGEPIPSICTESAASVDDLVTIKQTDTLVLVNCSKHFTTQRWVMPDGGTSTDATVYFIPSGVDTFLVHLYVSNDAFVSEYEAVKRVAVIP